MSVLSGAITYAVGKTAVHLFEEGRGLSAEDLESAEVSYKDWLDKGKRFVSGLVTPGSRAGGVFKSLESLQDLHQKGVITSEEYQAKKDELLSRV